MIVLPFLLLPICLSSNGKKIDKTAILRIYPSQIVAYHSDVNIAECTIVYLQNGQQFLIALSIEVYEAQVKQYFDEIGMLEKKLQNNHKLKIN
jgi:uncharacterized protein YlzI (FlbEa/FlbD family)